MDDFGLLLISGIVALLVGVALGGLIFGQGGDKTKPPAEGAKEALRLWYHRGNKTWWVQMDERMYGSPRELSDSQINDVFRILDEMYGWMGALGRSRSGSPGSVGPAAPAAPPAPVASVPSTPPTAVHSPMERPSAADAFSSIPGSRKPVSETDEDELARRLASLGNTEPPKKLSMNPIDAVVRAAKTEVSASASAPQTIAAQIDVILQALVQDTPYRETGVRLMEHPTKGLLVLVGGNQYEGIDAVPDAGIQRLIRTAAREWENRADKR